MCQFLLKKGAWLADVDEGGRTVLHWATLSQQVYPLCVCVCVWVYTMYALLHTCTRLISQSDDNYYYYVRILM